MNMERIIITKPMIGIFGMQVCAVQDATDEEILQKCNSENPSGTTAGWGRVVRHLRKQEPIKILPVKCEKYPDRKHFLIYC